MNFISLEIISNFVLLLAIFFSMTGFGAYINTRFLKIKTFNFYENFIFGIFFFVIYLQVHIIFFPINLPNSIILIFFLIFGFIKSLKEFFKIIDTKFIISIILSFLIIINSNVYPYQLTVFDYGLYHNTYMNWLNQDNIVLGLANLQFRFGYSGSSYLIGAFFNFYPFSSQGYIFSSSIFFVFLIFLLIKNINYKSNHYFNVFNILILYVIFKYILVEAIGDVSGDKIGAALIIFLIHNLVKNNFYKKNNNDILGFITLALLITLGPLTWFLAILFLIYYIWEKLLIIKNNSRVIVLCFFLCLIFGLLNFLKSGNIFFPIIFPIIETNFTINDDGALYQIRNFPKGYAEGLDWLIPKLKVTILKNNYVILYLASLLILILSYFTKYKKDIFRNKIVIKLTIIIFITIIFWFFNAPVMRYAKIYFWIGFILIFSLFFSNFLNKKFYPILFIFIFSYCVISSLNNLVINRNNTNEVSAQMKHPLTKINLNENLDVYLNNLNYTREKFHVPQLPKTNLIFEKKYFSKFYFKN